MASQERSWRAYLRQDLTAGAVLGIESVPDGLATGLLAGVNPLAGVYGYMIGTVAGALTTASAFMAVQGTGAMAIIVADVPVVHEGSNPARALFTLSMVTGVVMVVAGLLRLGTILRFVSNAVMVGFINAVGVNIVLGQLSNLTAYDAQGASRLARAIDTVLHPSRLDGQSLVIGLATIGLIVLLERTRLGSLGLVVALIATSAAAIWLSWHVATVEDLGATLGSLPRPQLPDLRLIPSLVIPAVSLALVGLIQGAGISANFPNEDGTYPDASRDFTGQGVANIASGIFEGMPVGGSVSASSLPALAGLLIVVGVRTITPADLGSVWRTGAVQKVVLTTTFVLTVMIPIQYAVLIGVGLSSVLYVVRQSNRVTIRRRVFSPDGQVIETDPPTLVPPNEVVILQPYGSMFFAAAPMFEASLPSAAPRSQNSVVILRLRERTDFGSTFIDVLRRYAEGLNAVGSKLVIVSVGEQLADQLRVTGLVDIIGVDNVYRSTDRVGRALEEANRDAMTWVAARKTEGSDDG